jgi:leucyl aminopeptidase
MKQWSFFVFTITALFLISTLATAEIVNSSQPTKIYFNSNLSDEDHLVLGIYENGELGFYGSSINEKSNGGLAHALKATEFEAKVMTSKLITAPMSSGYKQILLVGLGSKEDEISDVQWQNMGGNAIQQAIELFKTSPSVALDVSANAAANFAYGAKLGSYYFDKYYTDLERLKYQQQISFVTQQNQEANQYYATELDPIANAIWLTRNISNEPANVIYPQSFVKQWTEHFKGLKNIKIKVIDEKDMLKLNMGAIYGVGQGSQRPPRIMIVEYMGGDEAQAPVAIVGKGITFDTGGISIKGSQDMWNMKFDMSGAASSIGTLYALASRQAKVNVIGVAALAENMPGANAQRPGDVVTSMSGKTIQIRSTDAEGRLVLADGIYYTDITYNPALIVDLATLTGSASRALGKDYAALFSRHDDLATKFINMGQQTGDEVWHLPLNENHFKAIENNVADVMNSGPDAPGASAGAAFVGTFVREQTPWVHLDIAGVAWNDKATPIKASPGSTAFGIRLLNGYIKQYFEKLNKYK